jgi:hypothetical protein
MTRISWKARWLVVSAAFVLCVTPTIISYRPYVFRWDDASYLDQSIAVSRAFWSGSPHLVQRAKQVRAAMVSFRPPAMTLLGIPLGPVRTWDAANWCFVILGWWVSAVAALCLFLLSRIGSKPYLVVLASASVLAALGPWPPGAAAHVDATALLADSLFAWSCLASLLLLPYEERYPSGSALQRGIVWGLVLSLGLMIKVSFFYFVILLVPALLWVRYRRTGLRSSMFAFAGFLISAVPLGTYLLKYGRSSFLNGGASSFGSVSKLYSTSLFKFIAACLESSPGLWVFGLATLAGLVWAITNWAIRRRRPELGDALATVILFGFGVIVLASSNRQLRYSFPLIVCLPYLLAVLLSGKGQRMPGKSAVLVALVALAPMLLAAVPASHRADRQANLARADAVVNTARRCGDQAIVLATNSPTLNGRLLDIAVEMSGSSALNVNVLVGGGFFESPIEQDYRVITDSDLVVFQDDRNLSPPFSNLRVPAYRSFISKQMQFRPLPVDQDVLMFSKRCQ